MLSKLAAFLDWLMFAIASAVSALSAVSVIVSSSFVATDPSNYLWTFQALSAWAFFPPAKNSSFAKSIAFLVIALTT
jgi:hypothetical protein